MVDILEYCIDKCSYTVDMIYSLYRCKNNLVNSSYSITYLVNNTADYTPNIHLRYIFCNSFDILYIFLMILYIQFHIQDIHFLHITNNLTNIIDNVGYTYSNHSHIIKYIVLLKENNFLHIEDIDYRYTEDNYSNILYNLCLLNDNHHDTKYNNFDHINNLYIYIVYIDHQGSTLIDILSNNFDFSSSSLLSVCSIRRICLQNNLRCIDSQIHSPTETDYHRYHMEIL